MGSFWENLGFARYYIIGIAAVFILWMIGAAIYMKKKKGNNAAWLQEHSDAGKVYVKVATGAIKQGSLTVHTVDDEKPRTFIEGAKTGFYALPGTHVVESTFQSVRPGILYKSVTETYGPTKQGITVEAKKIYEYRFDPKEKTYVFTEHTDR